MRGALGGRGEGAGDARGFAHGDGVTGHSIGGVGDEVPADATTCHHQAIDVAGDQGAERDIVRLHFYTGVRVGRFLVLFGGEGVDIDREGRADDGVFLTTSFDEVFFGHHVTSLYSAAVADADLGGGRHDLGARPGAAGLAQFTHDVIDLGAGAHGRFGHLGGVGGVDAVFMVGHQQDEIVLDREERGLAVTRRDSSGLERGLEFVRTYMASVITDRVQLVRQGLGIVDGYQCVEGHRLARAGLFATELEFAASAGA